MRRMLLDTGPLVSLIDSSEKMHSACSLFAKGFSGQFLTTEPDIPMDFADATLVVLAKEADLNEIFTLDHRGFNTYRIRNKESFVIYPREMTNNQLY